jgi:hypothetical protein
MLGRCKKRRDASSPCAYCASVSGELHEILEYIRNHFFEVLPDVQEGIKYGMLHYTLNGSTFASLAAQKPMVAILIGVLTPIGFIVFFKRRKHSPSIE